MKKNGFTLIELLAVIVVLAIIMVIATLQVNKQIEKSRVGAAESTAKSIVKAVKLTGVENGLDSGTVECDGTTCKFNGVDLYLDGDVPTGTLTIKDLISSGILITKDKKYKISIVNDVVTISKNDGSSGNVPDEQKELFTWDSSTVISGLTKKGIEHFKSNGGELVIPEGVTEIASPNFNPETGEGTIDKGFSPFAIGKLNPNDEWDENKVYDPAINFITSVSLPSTIKKVGSFAFVYTRLNGELILPNGLETVGDFGFGACDNLSGVLNIPKSVKTIGKVAFAANDSSLNKITEINIYSSTSFDSSNDFYSFAGRPHPRIIGGGNEGDYNLKAFGSAGNNTSYYYENGKLSFVGPNVTSATIFSEIYNQIVANNNISLDSIGNLSDDDKMWLNLYLSLTINGWKYGGPIGFLGSTQAFTRADLKTALTTVQEGQTHALLNEGQVESFLQILDRLQMGLTIDLTGVSTIGGKVFSSIVTDTITIPNSETSIGETAFHSLIANNFNFGTGMKTIPKAIFYPAWTSGMDLMLGKANIKNITIPDGTTAIAEQAFRAVNGMSTLTIPLTVTSIGQRALRGCDDLRTIINKTGRSFDWGLLFNGVSSYDKFETGIYYGNTNSVTITE